MVLIGLIGFDPVPILYIFLKIKRQMGIKPIKPIKPINFYFL